MPRDDSARLFKRACKVIPGGVNSPVRAFTGVGGNPIYVCRGKGSRITTVEGRELIDLCGSWGPLLLGHAYPPVVEAIAKAAADGTTFGINTAREVNFAERLCSLIPPMEQIRLVSSGTEATMTALRIARGVTGRSRILKFDGCYHGHSDALLVSAGSGLLTSGLASSAGVPPEVAATTCVAPYNDLEAVERVIAAHGDELAAIIVEPVAGNMGLVKPSPGYLEGLRALSQHCGALLIFDEVITGFRLGPTTYGVRCGVAPDLTCLGKIIGGGMPIGAVGGRRSIMEQLAPNGPVYQAGTLSGNPVAVAAGMAMLDAIAAAPPYEQIESRCGELIAGIRTAAASAGTELHIPSLGGMFTPFFQPGPVTCLDDAKRSDTRRHAAFFHAMLERGVYLPPSQFEVAFISAAHCADDITAVIAAAEQSLAAIAGYSKG